MDLKRREIKFQIPVDLVDPICRYLDQFCDLDYHSQIRPDGFYRISSLYLDNDQMKLLENKRQNLARRFSMRIRSYGDQPTFPSYLEIKYKFNDMVNKKRARISSEQTLLAYAGQAETKGNPDFDNEFMNQAHFHIMSMGLKPKIMTQYCRRAYMGRFDPYSRVTFDKSLRCYFESEYKIFPDEHRYLNYDHEDMYVSKTNNVILELKCEFKVPFWMLSLIRHFQLRQGSFSKFESGWNFLTDDEYPNEVFGLTSMR